MVKPQLSQKKIFYIERNPFLRSMMEFAIKATGAEIYTTESITAYFYLLDDLRPDLILFDVQSVGDSLELLKAYSPHTIMVATGQLEDQAFVHGLVTKFIVKPIEARNLAESILSLLD